MPTLRQLDCAIELGPGNVRLREYGHKVLDGAVECYIAAPETSDIPFHVRVRSDGYIAPGLAAYVYMDGVYQCNRNRLRLQVPDDGVRPSDYEIDFKLRQKEEKTSAGTFIARDWFFTPLNIGNADKAPNMKNFKENVGTIEVIILRCKDGGGQELATDPAQTTVSRNPLPECRTPSRRAPSEHAPSAHAPSVRVPPGLRSSATSKAASNAGSTFVGGMMGIFDGAGDEPGYYKQYRPRNMVGQEPLPGHQWDSASGQYRYFNDQDPFVSPDRIRNITPFSADRYRPQAYTVGGGFSYQESQPPSEFRPKSFVPQSSPGYDFASRRHKVPQKDVEQPTKSTYDFSRRRKQEEEKPRPSSYDFKTRRRQNSVVPDQPSPSPQKDAEQPEQPGAGFAFVEDASIRLEALINRFESQAERYGALNDDAQKYRDRPPIYATVVEASRRKHDELCEIINEIGTLYGVVKQAIDSMDRPTWRRASDLLYEKGLYPPPEFELSAPPELDSPRRSVPPTIAGSRRPSEDWAQVGEGHAGHTSRRSSFRRDDSNKKPEGNADKKSGASWNEGKDDKSKKSKKSDDGWGNNSDGNKSAAGAQGDWGEDDNNSQSTTKPAGDTGWGNEAPTPAADDNWGNTPANKGNTGGWGSDADKKDGHGSQHPTSSRSHASRMKPTHDGVSETYSHGEPQPKPIIKSYWSDWKEKQAMPKPRIQPREVYEYPALPSPALPDGQKPKDITQAVHAGRGVNYAHKTYRPEYLDTMSKPYAIFTFKYRSKAALEKILHHPVDDANIREAKAEAKKYRLLNMPKDELVEELMKKSSVAEKSKAGSKVASVKGDAWGAPEKKVSTPMRPSSHKREPSRVSSNKGWGTGSVKPEDSVSQTGWGHRTTSKAANNNNGWDDTGKNGWETSKPPGSSKREKSAGGGTNGRASSKRESNNAGSVDSKGWGDDAKGHVKAKGWDAGSAGTANHFGGSAKGKTAGWKGGQKEPSGVQW